MAKEGKAGCARPTGGLVGDAAPKDGTPTPQPEKTVEVKSMISLGDKAPDFTAPAYHKGAFTDVKLSDHLGRWVVLCFYPGDFTFV